MIDLDEKERNEIEKRNARRRARDIDDLKKVLSIVEGRRFLAKLMFKSCATDENFELLESAFNPNHAAMSFTDGSRRFGLMIYNDIWRVSPQSMVQIRREFESEERNDANNRKEEKGEIQ